MLFYYYCKGYCTVLAYTADAGRPGEKDRHSDARAARRRSTKMVASGVSETVRVLAVLCEFGVREDDAAGPFGGGEDAGGGGEE